MTEKLGATQEEVIDSLREDLFAAAAEVRRLERQLADAKKAAFQEAALIAGGWTGPENTVENCALVSAVCRDIAKRIRAKITAPTEAAHGEAK